MLELAQFDLFSWLSNDQAYLPLWSIAGKRSELALSEANGCSELLAGPIPILLLLEQLL
jgi:hypothetical protein